jgi:hypothetical protein
LGHAKIKEETFRFVAQHFDSFLSNKDGGKDLGIDLYQEVTEAYQNYKVNGIPPLAELPEPPNTIIGIFLLFFFFFFSFYFFL